MINRDNWKAVQAYLLHREEVELLALASIRLEETWLRHLLEWAHEVRFDDVPKIRPTFQNYLTKERPDGSSDQLSHEYVRKIVSSARRFLEWLPKNKRGFRKLPAAWLDTLKPPRRTTYTNTHEIVTLDEIRAIASAPVTTTWERRIRAAAVFLFLSGLRVGAFSTLPIKAVDLDALTVYQWPSLGVKTKFTQQATSFLLDIPDLLKVIREWDDELRAILPDHGYWFAHLSSDTGQIDPDFFAIGYHRDTRVRKDLKRWLTRVELPYHSPHKFRHGHAVYALKQSKDVADLKAVSQNLMHSNLSVTDGVYGILSTDDIKRRVTALENNNVDAMSKDEVLSQLKSMVAQMEGEKSS